MNYRLIGAILVILSCGGFGFSIAASYRREIHILQRIMYMTDLMQSELNYRLTPLPQLCAMVGKAVGGTIRSVLEALTEEMNRQVCPDVSSCMHSALASVGKLPRSAERIFAELGSYFGQYDLPGQLRGIEAVRQSCERRLHKMEQDRENKIRCYQTLGLCAGMALVILFI